MLGHLFIGHWRLGGFYGPSLGLCLIVTLVFAVLALSIRAVSPRGAAAGALICFLLCAGVGFPALAALMVVFAMAWLTTKIGYQEKVNFGTAENMGGRSALQMFANLGVAAVCAALYGLTGGPVFLFAITASLSEAAADTVSSEVGQLSHERVWLITNWRKVPAGTDGGVTALGTISGLAAAIVVSAVCAAGGMLPWRRVGIPIFAALCGTLADSFLGAVFERRKLLDNDLVNFLGTLVAALIAIAA